MRALLTTYGSRGDVEPMAAVAVQLQAQGAEVRLCAPPDAEFAELFARAGVPMVPFERPWRSWVRPSTTEERVRRVADFIDAQFDTVVAAADGCDLILATAMSIFVGRTVADVTGMRHRAAIFAPTVLTDPESASWGDVFGPAISRHRSSLGLPPVADVRELLFTDRPLLAADPTLGPWTEPADLTVVPTGAWILPDDRPLDPELSAFIDAGPPPVYVGFGSMRTGHDTAHAAVEAIRAFGRRVLLARGWAELVADDREDCFAVGEVNQQALFSRVSAVVHHGGAGTTTTAARAGAPQVVVPQAGGDQPYWAGRVVALGIGAAADRPAPTAESLSRSIEQALSAETRTRAADVAASVRTEGAAEAARLLLGATA